MKVLLVARGSSGDLLPFLHTGRTLSSRGHDVTLYTHCYYKNVVEDECIRFVAIDTPSEFEKLVEDGYFTNHPNGYLVFLQRHVLPRVLAEYELIQEGYDPTNTVLVTQSGMEIAAQLVSEKLAIPLVKMYSSPINLKALVVLGELYSQLARNIDLFRNAIGLEPVLDWHAWVKFCTQGIILWPDWFTTSNSDEFPEMVAAGFLSFERFQNDKIPSAVQEILEAHEPPVLITGGTTPFMGSAFYLAGAEMCRLSGHRGILVTQHEDLVPKSLPSNVTWFRHLPFANIMPHMKAIIHHGGMGTIGQALAAGKPQLLLPRGADRTFNASRLQSLGVSEYLLPPQWQPEMLADAFHRLVNSPDVQKRCQVLASRLANTDAAASACDAIEKAAASKDDRTYRSLVIQANVGNSRTQPCLPKSSGHLEILSHFSPEKSALLSRRLRERKSKKN